MDEPVVRCHGRLGHLGDREWRETADYRVHRECDHDGAVFSSSYVDIRRKARKRLEEDTVVWRKDNVWLFFDDRDAAIIASLGYDPAIRHFLQHSRWIDWRFNVLRNYEGKKASVKEYNKKQRTAIGALEG